MKRIRKFYAEEIEMTSILERRVLIVIPMRNSSKMLKGVIEQVSLSEIENCDLLLIDNASQDNSLKIAESLVKNSPALQQMRLNCILNSENIGYGGSISKAILYGMENQFDWLIIIHSDDQTDWKKTINHIKNYIARDDCDIILGSRFISKDLTSKYSMKRRIGNYFFIFATTLFTGIKMSDPGAAIGGYRLSKLRDISFDQLNQGYHFHPELNLILMARKFKIESFALEWRDASASDGLILWKYGIQLLKFLCKVWHLRIFKKLDLESAVYETSH